MILINPPIVKPSEPPAGIAKLSGALYAENIRHYVLDANLEGIYYLLKHAVEPSDTWGRRAFHNLPRNIDAIKKWHIYRNIDRYKRVVTDINHVLKNADQINMAKPGLSDYYQPELQPVNSKDLIRAAAHPEKNPFFSYFSNRLAGLIKEENIRTAGFSINYLSQALSAFAMIGFLKKEFPFLNIVAGGGLITSWMKNPGWRDPFSGLIDHCISGPGEIPLITMFNKNPSGSKGYRPFFDFLPLKDYFSPGFVLPFSTSTGCYWNRCAFCPERAEQNRYVQIRPEAAINDLYSIIEHNRPVLIHFTDNALSLPMLRKITECPPGHPWYGFVRVSEELADPGFCKALKDSGCVMLKVGIESGDQRVLDRMNKGYNINISSSVLKSLKGAGIAVYIYILFGTPSESIEEARRTLVFIIEHADFIDFMNLALFNLPVNSSVTRDVDIVEFYEGDLSLYTDFIHPAGWGRRQVREFLDKEFKRNKEIQSIMRRQPPFFTSNHAPFFVMDHVGR